MASLRSVAVFAAVLVALTSVPLAAEAAIPTLTDIANWASAFSTHLSDVATNDLGTQRIQEFYDGFTWVNTTQNGTAIFEQVRTSFTDKIASRLSALDKLRDTVVDGLNNPATSPDPVTECCQVSTNMEFNSVFKAPVDTSATCYRVPNPSTSPDNVIKATDSLLATMANNRALTSTIKWQYYGSEDGVFINYPAKNRDSCYNYDPRFRPWYVQAATPTPKDIVVVIDSSGSMGGTRMSKAKEAAQVVLATMNPEDTFNVVEFDTFASSLTVPSCFTNGMARATAQNMDRLDNYVVDDVAAGGFTYYQRALTLAYQMLANGQQSGITSGGNRAILFMTDGEPSDSNRNDIINYINSKSSMNVKLLTFGFGSGLDSTAKNFLQQMASAGSGVFTHVPDSGDLRTAMGSYYTHLSTPNPSQPAVWTPPYFDASGLGLIVSAALPVYTSNTLRGVVGVDLTIEDLVADAAFFDAGEFSFAFVIDSEGRTIMHPLLPPPNGNPVFVDIALLEPGAEFNDNIRVPMMAGQSGNYHITLRRAFSRGDSRHEGVVTQDVSYNVHFAPVAGTKLRLGVAFADKDRVVETISSVGSLSAVDASVYHRLDLQSGVAKCKHLDQPATKTTSVFKLAPEAFKQPAVYLETQEDSNYVTQWVNWIKTGSSPPLDLHNEQQLRRDVIATDAISSYWESTASNNDVMPYTAWRYIGTAEGTFRIFPGAAFPVEYNPTARPWYNRALSFRGSNAISTPYKDAGSGSQVITMSRAIYVGPVPHGNDDPVAAVAGIDFTLGRFWSFIVDYTGCSDSITDGGNKVVCFVMDESGFIIVHPKFVDDTIPSSQQSSYWVGQMYPNLAAALVGSGNPILSQHRCNAFEDIASQLFYTSETRKIDTLSAEIGNGCSAKYSLSAVPGTNTYLVAVAEASCVFTSSSCTCNQATYNAPAATCQCPGISRLGYNDCSGEFSGSLLSDPTCPPAAVPREVAAAPPQTSVTGLASCYAVDCSDQATFLDCYSRTGCDFCQVDSDGNELPVADWFCQQGTCPEGKGGLAGGNGAGTTAVVRLLLVVAMLVSAVATVVMW